MIKNIQFVDIHYFGDINYYLKLINSTHIYYFNERGHQKGLGLNRIRILGANQILTLSVPLKGGRSVKAPLSSICIAADEAWQRIHWRSIHDSYRKAPWFEEYAPSLQNLYAKKYIFLWEWNLACTKWALNALKIKTDIMSFLESEFLANHPSSLLPGDALQYVSTPPTSNPQPPSNLPSYPQVFADRHGGFVPNLSILDLILNEGPGAAQYLKNVA
ncbi:MAG: WbqC family protein [Bacteroidetes bacterium]|nr:WbqC family protein [Bacteroidota bacterium]